jgi:DNA-binding MarR family transcriptional regulator
LLEDESSSSDEIPASLSDNDKMILSIIREDELTDFSFDGLRRRLGIHQQTLSRILDRLEDRGIIEKMPRGYTVTKKGRRLETHLLNNNSNSVASPYIPLIQTLLPEDIDIHLLLSNLQSKWFGMLRWFGCSRKDYDDYDDYDDNDEVRFKWLTEDGEVQVDATFSSSSLSIEAKFLKENDAMMSDAIKAAHQLIDHIIRLYSRQQQGGTKL